jgi:putative endonuclease
MTSDLERRISDHNKGYNRTTRAYRPFQVILITEFSTRREAREYEKYLKSGYGKEYLKKINPCPGGEIGRRTTLRGWRATVLVRIQSWALKVPSIMYEVPRVYN